MDGRIMADHAAQEENRSASDAGSSPNNPARPDLRINPVSPGPRSLMIIGMLVFLIILMSFIFGVLIDY
jgi:hypothetical protein